MQTLTKGELVVLAEAQPEYEIHALEQKGSNARAWKMLVILPGQQKTYVVQTALGKTKLWKNLDVLVDFVKETCPHAKTVHLTF